MTPKEKAKELFDKHFEFVEALSTSNQIYNAKQCALITVKELIKYAHNYHKPYFYEVKREIKIIEI